MPINSVAGPLAWSDAIRAHMRLSIAAICAAAPFAVAAPEGLGFTSQVTPSLITAYTRQFGVNARQRLASWVDFARGQKTLPQITQRLAAAGTDIDALRAVNAFFNRIPWLADFAHWGAEEYWATPAELSASNGGDCEDYSIAKYFLLKELGVPIERLRITYVKAVTINQAHMVLAYYTSPGADPLILDNLERDVRPASERSDLVPVYSFNDDDIVLVRDAQKASSFQIRAWRELLQKLEAEARL